MPVRPWEPPTAQDRAQLLGSRRCLTPAKRPAAQYVRRKLSSSASRRLLRRPAAKRSPRPKKPDSRCVISAKRSVCTTRASVRSSAASSPSWRVLLSKLLPSREPKSGDPSRGSASGPPDHKEAVLLMADENPTGSAERVPSIPSGDDRKVERAVLASCWTSIPITS